MPQKVVPDITKININAIDTVAPHYVWLDEDDEQVSQICRDFRTAMQFVNGWDERWRKLEKSRRSFDEDPDFRDDYSPWRKLTRTGKRPVKLKRIEVEISLVDATEEERQMAAIMMGE